MKVAIHWRVSGTGSARCIRTPTGEVPGVGGLPVTSGNRRGTAREEHRWSFRAAIALPPGMPHSGLPPLWL